MSIFTAPTIAGPAPPNWWPNWQVLVAFNNGPLDDLTQITTVASPAGSLGAHNVWTDITQWALAAGTARGRQHEIDRFQAGTMQIDLWNQDGRFDNWSTTSPYAGLVLPGCPIRLQATFGGTTYILYTGLIDSLTADWHNDVKSVTKLTAVDLFSIANYEYLISNLYFTTVMGDNPVLYWRANDPAGSAVAANQFGTLPLAVNHSTGVTFGQTGALVMYPGSSAQLSTQFPSGTLYGAQLIATSGTPPNSPGNAGISIEFWFKAPLPSTSSQLEAAASVLMGGIAFPAFVNVYSSGSVAANVGGTGVSVTTQLCDGNWHHVLFSVSNSTSPATEVLYIDGAQVGTATESWTSGAAVEAIEWFSNAQGTVCNIQEYAVYAYPLTATQAAAHFQAGQAGGTETSDARIKRVLRWMGIAYNGATIPAGNSQMQAPTAPVTGTTILSYLQLVELSENGALFMDASGLIRFYNRQNLMAPGTINTSPPTFGDNVAGGELPFDIGPEITLDTLDNYAGAQVQRQGGLIQTVLNMTARKRVGERYYQPNQLLVTTDAEALAYAQFETFLLSQPFARVRSIHVKPYSTPTTGAATTAVLALELMATATVNRHNLPGGGTGFSQTAMVESITHQVYFASQEWDVTLGFSSPAYTQPFWRWGTSKWDTTPPATTVPTRWGY